MFGEPLVADESQVRFPTFARPHHARRKGAEDRHAADDPPDVHRQVSFLFFFATILVYWIRNGEDVRKGTTLISSTQLRDLLVVEHRSVRHHRRATILA